MSKEPGEPEDRGESEEKRGDLKAFGRELNSMTDTALKDVFVRLRDTLKESRASSGDPRAEAILKKNS